MELTVAFPWLGVLGRELRGVRAQLVPFVASLAIGVAAIVAVSGLGDSVSRAVRLEARPLLGADVVARSSRPLPPALDAVEQVFPGVERASTVEFLTMVARPRAADGAPGRSVMAELEAVSDGWPFYGAPTLQPARPLAELLDPEGVVVEPSLLDRLGVRVGDPVRIGSATFTVRGVITREVGRMPSGFATGPRVLLDLDGLARTGLGDTGARITHRALFRAPEEARSAELAAWLERALPAGSGTVETWTDAQPAVQRSVGRLSSFLGLVALLSLVVGGVGVSQATRAWMARRMDALAVVRALGGTTGEVRALVAAQTVALAAAGSAVGALGGWLALTAAPRLLEGFVPEGAVVAWQPAAMARGAALGIGVALLSAAAPLARAARVPPLRVLRRDAEPLPASRVQAALGWLAVAAGGVAAGWFVSGDVVLGAGFAATVAGVAGVGGIAAAGAARALGWAAPRVRPWWLRHGLASATRPDGGFVPAVVSLAVGVWVVATTVRVEQRLFAQISDEYPTGAPSAFLVDVQPDQHDAVVRLVTDAGGTGVRSAPMVVARLASVDGLDIDALVAARGEEARWALTREQRLTYRATLPEGNELVAGAPFSDARGAELSLEQRYAETLGATVGSQVVFDVQGVPVAFTVSSTRSVSWETFDMNFFLIAEPGVLESAPQSVLVTVQLPADREPGVQDQLAAAFPNVTLVSVRSVLTTVRGLLERLGWGIRAVGGFTAAAGVSILASGVAADAARQGRRVALSKALGTTRAQVVGLFAVEYAVLGALAGSLGAAGAVATSALVTTRLLHLPWRADGWTVAATVAGAAALTAVAGVAANARALQVPPARVLRGD